MAYFCVTELLANASRHSGASQISARITGDEDELRITVEDSAIPREQEVLSLMAERHFNSTLAQHLSITERAVGKHVSAIFTKLDLSPSQAHHRRVLAVVTYSTPDLRPVRE